MPELIDTLLLVALPASGKSEVRKYLSTLNPEQCRDDFRLGPNVQLDDFPYVHFMRRIDEELGKLEQPSLFFHSGDRPFKDAVEWGTLIELLNEDYAALHGGPRPADGAGPLLERLERARLAVGGPAKISQLAPGLRARLAEALAADAAEIAAELPTQRPGGSTVVIEFARGGPQGATFPLDAPMGYAYSLARLSHEILARASILYIWVTPEESRRKNEARADPDDPGSILHHGVPIEVMLNDYGCDDIEYLIGRSDVPGTIRVEREGRVYHLPTGRFDNRVDKTSFIRDAQWPPAAIAELHQGLKRAFAQIARAD